MLAVLAAVGLVGCTDQPVAPGAPSTPTATPTAIPPSASPSRSPTPAPVDALTGGRISTRPVVAVKIDNTSAARPQVGLDEADHVWVQEVEAGITRLVAVFHTTLPDQVGPVRSARSTDVELLGLYGSPQLVYSGANADVTRQLARSDLPTASGGLGFRRVSGRTAPYDLMADLPRVVRTRSPGPGALGLRFAADDPDWASATPVDATTVTVGSGRQRFSWSGGRYRVEPNDTSTDNVVIMSVTNVADGNADVNGARSVKSRTVGSGRVVVLRDGRSRTGTWSRASRTAGLSLADGHDQPIRLTPGRTWFLLKG